MEWMNRPTPYSGLGGHSAGIPDFVSLDDVPSSSGAVSLGIGVRGPVTVSLDSESPHILVNAPTGLGKSTVARSIAVQCMSAGDIVVFLDRKMHSHGWARGLEPVTHYADDTYSIGSALVNLGWELRRRNLLLKEDPTADIGPRVIVVFEETNATLSRLKDLDKGSEGMGSLEAFEDLLFMGRTAQMHVIAFAQLASYRSGLTADLLENFGTRVMIGYSDTAWRWLARDCGRYRVAPAEVGRGMVCMAGRARETQLVYVDENSAREAVLNSVPAQRRARELSGGRSNLPATWRQSIGR